MHTTSPSTPGLDAGREAPRGAGVDGPRFTLRLTEPGMPAPIAPSPNAYTVVVPLAVRQEAERQLRCAPGAQIFNPGAPLADRLDDLGGPRLSLRIERDLVAYELRSLAGRPPDGDVMFQQQLSLEHAAGEAIGSLLEDLANQLQRPRPALQHPAVWLRQLRTVLAACLIYQPHNYSSLLTDGQSPQRPRHLRRVLEYAEAHLSEHLTLDVLADAAGCSARTLSTAFQTYLQVTPMTYVRNLRLDRVRRDLSIGNELVATVAYRWGFTHLGRFSSYYYQRFAERPSETLAREEQSSSPGGAFGTGRFDVKSA